MKVILFILLISTCGAKQFEVNVPIGINLFQQQAKEEIGGENLPILFNYSTISFGTDVYYNITDYLSAGAFVRYDFGNREVSQIKNQNSLTVEQIAASEYSELWIGPKLKATYKQLFLAIGYGLLGSRDDEFNNISNSNGDSSPKQLSSFAWLLNLGGNFELTDDLDFIVMVEYRVRYYDKIDGKPFVSDNKLGTQNILPLIGISYNFDL